MTVSIATLPPQIQQRYNAKLLSTPERNLIHNLFATPVELPDNQGFIDRQSRYERLDLFPVPLDDSQLNPPAQLLNRVDVDCRVRNYATYIVLTKDVMITNEDLFKRIQDLSAVYDDDGPSATVQESRPIGS